MALSQFDFVFEEGDFVFRLSEDVDVASDESASTLAAYLCEKHTVPSFARDVLRSRLADFLRAAAKERQCAMADAVLQRVRQLSDDEASALADDLTRRYSREQAASASSESAFVTAFQTLLHTPRRSLVDSLLTREHEMADEIRDLLKIRDWELERLRCEHSSVIDRAVEELSSSEHASESVNLSASRHLERVHVSGDTRRRVVRMSLKEVEANYESQLSALMDAQRREYRALVLRLCDELQLSESTADSPAQLASERHASAGRGERLRQHAESVFDGERREDSFTIYLGAQHKSMHNLRLVAADALDLCRQRRDVADCDSHRLQMAIELYGGHLSAVVVLVDSRPNYHVCHRTGFARACERSTEFHFDRLDIQLDSLAKKLAPGVDGDAGGRAGGSLRCGDVYLTRHSNLSQVQVAFHLVGDGALHSSDISSRHPSVGALRNVVRLCSRFGVTTLAVPLLLVDRMHEEHTVSWCLKRAELVFKCVKGFLMEVASLVDSANSNAHSSQQHYTVQFLVPPEISHDTYLEIADMIPNIFHLVTPVVVQ